VKEEEASERSEQTQRTFSDSFISSDLTLACAKKRLDEGFCDMSSQKTKIRKDFFLKCLFSCHARHGELLSERCIKPLPVSKPDIVCPHLSNYGTMQNHPVTSVDKERSNSVSLKHCSKQNRGTPSAEARISGKKYLVSCRQAGDDAFQATGRDIYGSRIYWGRINPHRHPMRLERMICSRIR
jgi:hypothetical protein